MLLAKLLRVLGSADRRDGRNLTHDEAYEAFLRILDGTESEVQVGAFFMALRWKGVTVEELTGFALAARERADLPCEGLEGVVCVSPPQDGYDDVPPIEVASCLLAAAAGGRVLLISERCVAPRRGITAASAMEGLGMTMTWEPSVADENVRAYGFGAISASGVLPAWLSLRRVRADLGVRTPLSTVEKLVAPSTAAVVLGAQHGPVLGAAVETMAGLGHPRGIAIQGLSGGVTPSLRRRTRGIELAGEHQVPLTVEPSDFGLTWDGNPELPMFGPPEDGKGTGDNPQLVQASAEAVESALSGDPGPCRNAAILGAAVVLKAAGRTLTLAEGVDAATKVLENGAAAELLARLRR